MALYAVDGDDLLFASHAEKGKVYWCLDCFGPVKKRLGKDRLPHFYHIHPTPHCRLYSKTEDHLVAQLDLQKLFAPGVLQIERPFIEINRVADLCWESEKVIFEIQCSPLTPKEAELRIRDYGNAGYEVVWLLDDKRYNKKILRPAEGFLRQGSAYYLSIKQALCYDQFEVFADQQRVRKGRPLPLDLQKLRRSPENPDWDETAYPRQILNRQSALYFVNDRLDRALKARHNPTLTLSMRYWRQLETQLALQKPSRFWRWFERRIRSPYEALLHRLVNKVH